LRLAALYNKVKQEVLVTVTVKKVGGSVAVVIPAAIARELALTDGTPLDVTTTADGIVMRRRGLRPRRRIASIVADMRTANYRRRRAELGDEGPVGREPW
jgi:antitoxin component of MazEF toxin-antitoxin module